MTHQILEASLGPREDRDGTQGCPRCECRPTLHGDSEGLQSLGRARVLPHYLRHRRSVFCIGRGRSWAEIARFVGQRKLSITADTSSHVMSDGTELDYGAMVT